MTKISIRKSSRTPKREVGLNSLNSKACLIFAVLNILDRNVVESFAVSLLFSFHRIVLLTGKLARVEPFAPPVGACHELDTAVQRDRVYRHPDTEHPGTVYGVVSLVMVPGSLLLCPW